MTNKQTFLTSDICYLEATSTVFVCWVVLSLSMITLSHFDYQYWPQVTHTSDVMTWQLRWKEKVLKKVLKKMGKKIKKGKEDWKETASLIITQFHSYRFFHFLPLPSSASSSSSSMKQKETQKRVMKKNLIQRGDLFLSSQVNLNLFSKCHVFHSQEEKEDMQYIMEHIMKYMTVMQCDGSDEENGCKTDSHLNETETHYISLAILSFWLIFNFLSF